MSYISTRHIRDKFYTWVDRSNTKNVTTLCGMRSTDAFCGIPGVTQQDVVVLTKTGEKPGWCYPCCREMAKRLAEWFRESEQYAHPDVTKCYTSAADVLLEIQQAYSDWGNYSGSQQAMNTRRTAQTRS